LGLQTKNAANSARVVLDELEAELAISDAAYAHAQWRQHFGVLGAAGLGMRARLHATVLADHKTRRALCVWENGLDDPMLARRAMMLLRRAQWDEVEFHPQIVQLRNRVAAITTSHRLRVNGCLLTRSERLTALRKHSSREQRRQAWLSARSLSDLIEDDVRRLIRLRQRLAQKQGFKSYPNWAMAAMGLDPLYIEALFDDLWRSTERAYRDWLNETARLLKPVDGLRPWDLTFAAESATALPETAFPRDGAVSAALDAAERVGLRRKCETVRVDTAPLSHSALCFAIQRPDDVRILVNAGDGQAHYAAISHEFGHALHWRSVRQQSHLMRQEPAPFNESMACLWARFALESNWLHARGALSGDAVTQNRKAFASRSLLRLRWLMAQATFECRAYEAVDGDLNGLWCDVFDRYLGVPSEELPGWAHSLSWSSHPIYIQNYVIGEVVASQTLSALRDQFGSLESRDIGAWLTANYFEAGSSVPWRDKVVHATGAPLSTDALLAELNTSTSI
jgi:peptidyl-dipeptidase A